MGFYQSFMDPLREEYLNPISSLLYPDVLGKGTILDSQRAFIVSYKVEDGEESTELSLHYDNAEVTLNISLSDGFAGGELYFGGLWKVGVYLFDIIYPKMSEQATIKCITRSYIFQKVKCQIFKLLFLKLFDVKVLHNFQFLTILQIFNFVRDISFRSLTVDTSVLNTTSHGVYYTREVTCMVQCR